MNSKTDQKNKFIQKHPEFDPYLNQADVIDIKIFQGTASLREFISSMLSYYPWWMVLLYRIREYLVRILGLVRHEKPDKLPHLKPDELSFLPGEEAIFFIVRSASEENFWICETPEDKHLKAYLGVAKETMNDSTHRFYVITSVFYKHWTGIVYFNLIRPFHHWVVFKMAHHALKRNVSTS